MKARRGASPDALELVLAAAWSRPRSKSKKRHIEVSKAIAKIADAWEPPIPLDPVQVDDIRALLRDAPRRAGDAKQARSGMTLLLLWWLGGERDFDLSRMLSALSLHSFREVLTREGYAPASRRDYIGSLDRLGAWINPNQAKEWRALGSSPNERAGYALPLDENEVWALFLLAWAQPRARLRDGLLGLLYLTLGVGLYEGEVSSVAGTDVRRTEDGITTVRVGGRLLIVRPRYAPGLLKLASRVGNRLLVPGASGRNKASEFVKGLFIPAGTPKPDVNRLVATYRWWVDEVVGIGALVAQCGPNVLVHLADVHRRMPRRIVEDSGSVLAPPDDDKAGPWSPDWPVQRD